MAPNDRTAPAALITGASSGLGVEFARLFAADRHDLVLIARRKDRLEQLADELAQRHGVRALVVAADLQQADAVPRIVEEVGRLGVEIEFLVNNAGYGTSGSFAESDPARELGQLHVNVVALTALTRAFLPAMIARGRGRILNVGSTAGFQPGPFMAVYYATKAYVVSFTEALGYELRGTGVTATVSCPGPTLTEFAGIAGNDKSRLFEMGAMTAEAVARQGYHAMHVGQPVIVHGLTNQLGVFAQRFAPRAVVRAIAGLLNRTTAGKQLPSA